MKRIVSLLLCAIAIQTIQAQTDIETKYFSQDFTDTFKKESIVMYRYFKEFTYTKNGINDYKVNAVIRIQYKLNDISALDAFSTMPKKNDFKRIDIKQIKPNGKVNTIYEYLDKKYPDDGYDPADMADKKNKEENIPLEDLAIGDIIDYRLELTYTTKIDDPRSVMASNGKIQDTYIKVPNHNQYRYLPFNDEYLVESYAVVSKLVVYTVPSDLKLIQRSINTNFKFEETKKSDMMQYQCLATNLPAFDDEDFSYNLRYNPVVKLALIQTNSGKQSFYPFQFEDNNVSQDEIVALGRKMFRDKKYLSNMLAYKKVSQLEDYKYSQNDIYTDMELSKFFKAFVNTFCKKDKNKYESLNKMHEYLTNEDKLNQFVYGEMAYATILGRFAKHLGLKYQLMAALPKYQGNWNEIISPHEITWGIYLPRKEGDLYITSYAERSNIYQRQGAYCNTDIILFDPLKDLPYSTVKYPEIPAEDNLYQMNTVASLCKEGLFEYDFVNSFELHGMHKYSVSDLIDNQFSTKQLRTAGFFGLVDYSNVYNFKEFNSNEQLFEEIHRLDSCWTLYYQNYYNRQMEAYTYEDYDFDDLQFDSTVQTLSGEYEDNDSAVYRFKNYFKASGLLSSGQSDSFKVLRLGQMITTQYHLSNFTKNERKCDIFNTNLRKIAYNIEIEVPNGFKPLNLEDFNVSFENEAGIFKAEAVMEDGKIILKVYKIYKTHYLPKEKWPMIVEFLQTSEKYYQKILLLSLK